MSDIYKKNKKAYNATYNKLNYTQRTIRLRSAEAAILTEFAANLNISENLLLQKCLLYCYNEMIDVSGVKLSTPDKSDK